MRFISCPMEKYSTKRPVIVLTGDEKVNLGEREGQALFRNLNTEVIFFSCCELGRHETYAKDSHDQRG